MKLTIPERVALLSILNEKYKRESYSGIKEVRRTRMLLQFREEEINKFDMKEVENTVSFNKEKASGYLADIPMGEWMTSEIRIALLEKDRNHELSQAEIPLFEKFVMDYITI